MITADHVRRVAELMGPYWDQFNEQADRHDEHLRALWEADHETMGRVLRSHLVVESFLDSHLAHKLACPDIRQAKLRFVQKLHLIPAESPAQWVKPGLKELNDIRNAFSHRLDKRVAFNDIPRMMEVLKVARVGVAFPTPILAIETFSSVSATFLSFTPKEIEDSFAKALRAVLGELGFTFSETA